MEVGYIVSLGTTGKQLVYDEEQLELLIIQLKWLLVGCNWQGHFGGSNTSLLCQSYLHLIHQVFPPSIRVLICEAFARKASIVIIWNCEVSPLPMIIYNVPSRTASNISAVTLLRLAMQQKN
jgi:4-hydroxy-tetrahydrodipicolinate synthase